MIKPSPLCGLILTHKFDPNVHDVRINIMRPTIKPEYVQLGEKRLNARFLKLVDDFSKDPTASIPEASGDWPGSKAAYRFFDNPRVRPRDIRAALRRDALDFLPPDGPILAIQDTTSLRLHRPRGDHRPGLPGARPALAACSCIRCSPSPPRGSPAGSSISGPGPATRPSLGKRADRNKKATADEGVAALDRRAWRPPRRPCRRAAR